MDKKEEIRKKTLEELESMKDNVDNAIKNIKNSADLILVESLYYILFP